MVFNRSIQGKIQTYILGSVIIVYLIVFGFISFSNRKQAFTQSTRMVASYADRYAQEIGSEINADMSLLRTLSNVFKIDKRFTPDQFQDVKNVLIKSVFEANPKVYSLWDSWEYSYIKEGWNKPYGRTSYTIWKENGVTKETVDQRSLDGDPAIYAYQKRLVKENAFEPYMDQFAEGKSEAFMMSSLAVPMVRNGKFIGIMAEDLTLNQFESLIKTIKPHEDAKAVLVSQNGVIAGFPEKEFLNKKVTSLISANESLVKERILDSIKLGKRFSFIAKDSLGVEKYFAFSPIVIGRDGATVWSLGISIPVSSIYAQTNGTFLLSLLIGLIGLAIIGVVNILLSRSITKPLKVMTLLLDKMSKGEVIEGMKVKDVSHDEIGDMTNAINKTIDSLLEKEMFANEIGKGNLQIDLNLVSTDDSLGKSLLEMRNDLRKAKGEEAARKESDDKVRWAADAISKINDIIRNNNGSIQALCSEILKGIVYAVDANQGGLFLINEEDSADIKYEQMAAFAYNRNKLSKKIFRAGEGVIGACIAEKEMIYLKELPDDFVEITSGLGSANPKNILIVPFMHDGNVLGVLEIASFRVFEQHEIEFVLKVADNFASTISFTRANDVTQKLLEQSKMQAEMMAAQEEEMRQNLEELRSTQEESHRQQSELNAFVSAIGDAILWTEYDLDGNTVDMSDKLIQQLGTSKEHLLSSNAVNDYIKGGGVKDTFEPLWNRVRTGTTQKVRAKRLFGLENKILMESFSPVKVDGRVEKIVKVSVDITEYLN